MIEMENASNEGFLDGFVKEVFVLSEVFLFNNLMTSNCKHFVFFYEGAM